MLLIEDDKLVHVDSSLDILEHYGVKGMKWGKRMKRTLAVYANKDTRRQYLNLKKETKQSYKKLKKAARNKRDREYDDAEIEYDVAMAKNPGLRDLKKTADKYADADDAFTRAIGRSAEQEYYKKGGADIENRYDTRVEKAASDYSNKVRNAKKNRKSTLREFKYGGS